MGIVFPQIHSIQFDGTAIRVVELDQQVEEKIISFETQCDVDDKNNGLNNDIITLYFPFDANNEEIKIRLGDTIEVNTYGILQKGRVLGVRPSQLGGVKVMCKKI